MATASVRPNSDDPSTPFPTVRHIQSVVEARFGLTHAQMVGQQRSRSVARPRQIAMWICRRQTTQSLPSIGTLFGNRDHTTVLYAVRRVDSLIGGDPALALVVSGLEASI